MCDTAGQKYQQYVGGPNIGYANTYTPPTKGLSFAQAIVAVLEGKRVRRAHLWGEGYEVGLLGSHRLGVFEHGDGSEKLRLDYDDLTANDWYVVTE